MLINIFFPLLKKNVKRKILISNNSKKKKLKQFSDLLGQKKKNK